MADTATAPATGDRSRVRSRKAAGTTWIARIVLVGAALATVVPIVWMVVVAFLQPRAIVAAGWEFDLSWENFSTVFSADQVYGRQVLNSVVLVVLATGICLVVGGLAAYSLSRLDWRPRTVVTVLAVAGLLQIVPPMALVPGLFTTLTQLGLNGTLAGLVLLNVLFNLPFTVIMLKFTFDSLPGELRESSALDGASEFGTFWRIMLPLAVPGVAAVGIFTAIQVWNEFLFGLVFTTGGETAPITVGIATLVQPQEILFGPMAAVGVVTGIPIILLAIVANRQIVSGLTRGAVKG